MTFVVLTRDGILEKRLFDTLGDVEIACTECAEEIPKKLGTIPHRLFDFGCVRYLIISPNGIRFFDAPVRNSSGSEALYIASAVGNKGGFLLQYLPPRSTTSRHYHTELEERFHNLIGKCSIIAGGREVLLSGSSYSVAPGVLHQLKTYDIPSLNVLEMKGNWKGMGTDDHIYK